MYFLNRKFINLLIFSATVILGLFLFSRDASAIIFFEERFDDSNYGVSTWLSQGATHTYLPTGGWVGGAARFTPPSTSEGYSGLALYQTGNLGGTRLNTRFLIYYGSSFVDNDPGNKLVIIGRDNAPGTTDPDVLRSMIITRRRSNWMTMGACDNIDCIYKSGLNWPDDTDYFRVGDPPNREEQWISVELEANAAAGYTKLYIFSQDGQISGTYVTKPMAYPGGTFGAVVIVGGYFGWPGSPVNTNNYFLLDELVIADNYIGPPAGFVAGADITPPTTPTNLSATAISSSQINLSWTASTDSVGVTGYRIYRNGSQIATTSSTTYSNTGLSPSTSYSYTVAAYDAAGNVSSQSTSASAITQVVVDTIPPANPTGLTVQ